MRHRLALLVFFLIVSLSAAAQTPGGDIAAPDRAAIRQIISGQMAAFRRDDGPGAFAYASPSIQALFGTPEIFMDMVRNGYQPVYRPQSATFADLAWVEGQLYQFVDIIGPDGLPVVAAYAMQRQKDGTWRINGCQLLPPRERSA